MTDETKQDSNNDCIFCGAKVGEYCKKPDCEHKDGYQVMHYDSDGCGYYVWYCSYCCFSEIVEAGY